MYLLVRNDDDRPLVFGIFYDKITAYATRDILGSGYFIVDKLYTILEKKDG